MYLKITNGNCKNSSLIKLEQDLTQYISRSQGSKSFTTSDSQNVQKDWTITEGRPRRLEPLLSTDNHIAEFHIENKVIKHTIINKIALKLDCNLIYINNDLEIKLISTYGFQKTNDFLQYSGRIKTVNNEYDDATFQLTNNGNIILTHNQLNITVENDSTILILKTESETLLIIICPKIFSYTDSQYVNIQTSLDVANNEFTSINVDGEDDKYENCTYKIDLIDNVIVINNLSTNKNIIAYANINEKIVIADVISCSFNGKNIFIYLTRDGYELSEQDISVTKTFFLTYTTDYMLFKLNDRLKISASAIMAARFPDIYYDYKKNKNINCINDYYSIQFRYNQHFVIYTSTNQPPYFKITDTNSYKFAYDNVREVIFSEELLLCKSNSEGIDSLVVVKNGDTDLYEVLNKVWDHKQSTEIQESFTYFSIAYLNYLLSVHYNSKNEIYYGPPGTGKTFNAVSKANKIEVENKANELQYSSSFFTTFHQSISYEDFIEGIKPVVQSYQIIYKVIDGLFKRVCIAATASYFGIDDSNQQRFKKIIDNLLSNNPSHYSDYEDLKSCVQQFLRNSINSTPKLKHRKFVLTIDEINRGNVSQIFGELITLIEEDKRYGANNTISVTLPYSGESFIVPPNLYIIGTMNTADRSVEALDTALRRRFVFKEMKPDYSLLEDVKINNEIEISEMLRKMNERISEIKCSRDYEIGHAYFWPLKEDPSLDKLKTIFANSILPLLKEYFYGDYSSIKKILKEQEGDSEPIVQEIVLNEYYDVRIEKIYHKDADYFIRIYS